MYYNSRRRGQDGVGAVIDFLLANARFVIGVGGAAILGIATLAVKRLIERAGRTTEENKPIEVWEELSLVKPTSKQLQKEIEDVVMKKVALGVGTKRADLSLPVPEQSGLDVRPVHQQRGPVMAAAPVLRVPFRERLQQFYMSHACVSLCAAQRAQRRALEIGTEIQAFLRAKYPTMPLGELRLAGSLLDNLQVVTPDHASLLVHLQVEESLWSLIKGEDTFLSQPQLFLIRRENLEYFPRGRSYWDHFLVGGYLSARLVAEQLAKAVTEAMNWPSLAGTLECDVRPVLSCHGEGIIELEVCPTDGCQGDEPERLFVRVLPTVCFGETEGSVCARPRAPCDHAWFQSLYPQEAGLLASLDQSDCGIRRKCLKTLKAICRSNPTLRLLSGRHLGNLMLHMAAETSDWSEDVFEERILQAIEALIGYLEQGCLPSYFKPAVNLLLGLSDDDIDQIGFMLYCSLSQPEILLI